MKIGIFAKTFAGTDPLSVLTHAKAAGYDCVQYNMACSGLASMPDSVAPKIIDDIARAAAETGVEIVALSATYNMIHPDTAIRAAGIKRLAIICEAAASLKIPLVTLCTGTRDATDQWRHHPDNTTASAWADLVTEMRKAALLAERFGVSLGIEPEQDNVVTNARSALKLIDEVKSPTIRIVLDPANLFEKATTDEARRIVAAATDLLAGHIALAHAKDRYPDGRFGAAGEGVVDFAAFIDRLKACGFEGPIVTHGLEQSKAPDVARFLRGLMS